MCAESVQICWGELLLLQEAKTKAVTTPSKRAKADVLFRGNAVSFFRLPCWATTSDQSCDIIWLSGLHRRFCCLCVPQASSVPETRQPKGTTDSWIKFKHSVGSVRTLVTLEEIRVASRSLDLELELPVSACWLCPTTQKVRTCRLTAKTRFCGSAAVERLMNALKWQHFRHFWNVCSVFWLHL